MALKFPRRRVRPLEVQDIQDMNDTLLPVVEEMGRLNEHNFDTVLSSELSVGDMDLDVAFKVAHGETYVDVSDNDIIGNLPNLTRISQSELWISVHPTILTKSFTSEDGGSYRLIAGGQYSSEKPSSTTTAQTLFAFKIDGAVLPDSIIGDQDFYHADPHMEIGFSGQADGFLLDLIVYLAPGIHTVEVVAQTRNLVGVRRETVAGVPQDLFIFSAEALYWEMSR